MEEITLTRYQISDGRVFENKEEAAAIEQKLFEEWFEILMDLAVCSNDCINRM